jgi:hypothetical protein
MQVERVNYLYSNNFKVKKLFILPGGVMMEGRFFERAAGYRRHQAGAEIWQKSSMQTALQNFSKK